MYPSACLFFFLCISVCLSACLSVSLSVCLSVYLSVCLFFSLYIYLSVCLSICPPICLSAYLSLCLFFCLSVCLSICLSVGLAVCLNVCLYAHPSVRTPVHQYDSVSVHICLSICPHDCKNVYSRAKSSTVRLMLNNLLRCWSSNPRIKLAEKLVDFFISNALSLSHYRKNKQYRQRPLTEREDFSVISHLVLIYLTREY
jgi:hypothetical protein